MTSIMIDLSPFSQFSVQFLMYHRCSGKVEWINYVIEFELPYFYGYRKPVSHVLSHLILTILQIKYHLI